MIYDYDNFNKLKHTVVIFSKQHRGRGCIANLLLEGMFTSPN